MLDQTISVTPGDTHLWGATYDTGFDAPTILLNGSQTSSTTQHRDGYSEVTGYYIVPDGVEELSIHTSSPGARQVFITRADSHEELALPFFEVEDGWTVVETPPYPLESVANSGQLRASGGHALTVGDLFSVKWNDNTDEYALGEIAFALAGGRIGIYRINHVQGNINLITSQTELTFKQIENVL